MDVAAALGERLGPSLFQLPPDFKCDVALLRDFLAGLRGKIRAAFEFRNRSWFDPAVMRTLSDGGAALCIAESEKISAPIERTAPFVYLRLRNEDYDRPALEKWAERLSAMAADAEEIYVYFKHENHAPELAARLREMLQGAL